MNPRPASAPRLYRPAARVAFLRFIGSHRWSAAAVAVALPVALAFAGSSGCSGDDETETEAAAVASAAPAPPAATVAPPEEDAGAPEPQASTSKPKAPAADPTGLQMCCVSLRNNAKTAPDEQKDMLLAAAAVCESAVRSPDTRPGLIAVRTALRGAKLPAECK